MVQCKELFIDNPSTPIVYYWRYEASVSKYALYYNRGGSSPYDSGTGGVGAASTTWTGSQSSCYSGTYNLSTGKCDSTSAPHTVTESQLAQKIQQSSATSADLFNKTLNDSVTQGVKVKDIGLVPSTVPASVTASPVTSTPETVQTQTSPNPDGSTTTTTIQEQTTATPHPRGSTTGDAGVDWETSTTQTQTAHNNTSGVDQVTTTTTNAGTSTTAQETPDYCVGHPDLVGCTPVGVLTDQIAPTVTSTPLPANFTPPSSVSGSCPVPFTRTLTSGQVVSFDYEPICTFAGGIRLVVIAMAFLSAAYIVSGSVRIDS